MTTLVRVVLVLAILLGVVVTTHTVVAHAQDDDNSMPSGRVVDADAQRVTRKQMIRDDDDDNKKVTIDTLTDAITDDVPVAPIARKGRGKRASNINDNETKGKIGRRSAAKVDGEDPNDLIDNDAYVHFFSAFVASFSVIIVSEIGDKTFFIAAVMAMRHPRWEVFASAIAALALMTVLSAAAGNILPNLLSPVWTHYASMVLFFFFGFKLLKQGWETDPNPKKNEELEEVEEELERSEHEEANPSGLEAGAANGQPKQRSIQIRIRQFFRRFFSPVFIQGFTMTFLAEWGDRSQIATIALAAARDPVGVTLGGILGHAICTGGAVISGKFAAARISERAVAYFGGACFLLCGLYSLYAGPDEVAL